MTENRNDEPKTIDEAVKELAEMTEKLIEAIETNLIPAFRTLDEINSNYPATREFLERKGVRLVSELSEEGKKELEEYLLATIIGLRNRGSESN